MPKSTTTCNNILALIYNATPWANIADNAASSPITTIQAALATASYSAASNASSNEATGYTNYVRQTVARSVAGWTAPSGGATSNAAAIEYPQCGVTGATLTHVSTGVAVSGATALWHYGALNSSLAVANGITPQFAIGALTVTES